MKEWMSDCVCVVCGDLFKIELSGLKRRKVRPGEIICKKCYRKMSKWSKNSDYYPKELQSMLNEDVWDYDTVVDFLEKISGSKKKVRFVCDECSEESIMRISRMGRRSICGFKPICKKCSLKFATGSDAWKDANSKAQYVAQNRPEVIEKQRNSQLKLMREDPLYAEKRSSKSYVSGMFKGFRFDSSWELYFIVHCLESSGVESISRYKGSIEYFDPKGVKRKYFPDFVVIYKDGCKRIIEIKGSKKYNNFHEKFNAARKKHGANYIVYEERDLINMGIPFRRESYLKEFYKKNYDSIVFFDNVKIRSLKERIKIWLE